MRKEPFILLLAGMLFLVAACGPAESLDSRLQSMIAAEKIMPLEPGTAPAPAKIALGEALFFDKILSGNQDISCATCHHPTLAGGDGLPLSIGTGGRGLGPERTLGVDRLLIARNAPEIFNRGAGEWRTMFWDGRVALNSSGEFISPAGAGLPSGLDSVLAVQAMFPVTSRAEMLGEQGDYDSFGQINTLAAMQDGDFPAVWLELISRLLANPEYAALFAAAYPDLSRAQLGFQHAANALAAYEIAAFTLLGSPWQRYLQGDTRALSVEAKQGALLFFGDAGCAECHQGPLLTDQQYHVLAVPQLGPGKEVDGRGEALGIDYGRFRETGNRQEQYAFRTPTLYNVAATGPWMHNGAYASLEAVIAHHLDPQEALLNYDPTIHLPEGYAGPVVLDSALLQSMLAKVDPLLSSARPLSDGEIQAIVAFLEALTDPAAFDLASLVPARVPSGLPVKD